MKDKQIKKQLLPCPFCNSKEIEIVRCEEECCGAKIRYFACNCGCEKWVSDKCSDEQAVIEWNTRANQ